MNKKIIVINKDIMEEYQIYYFEKNPRCRVFPKYFENPIPMSWNTFISKQRMIQNTIKGKYKKFAIWLAERDGINNLNLEKVCITFDFYFKDRRRRDCDNYTSSAKFINDGFTEAGVFIDDASKYLELKFPPHKYDKHNPRLELILEY
jgi:Holliday junction resolvase RusA-like endonuclease